MIAIVDYGVGNLFSVASSLRAIGADSMIAGTPGEIRSADKILLPGVGAFEDARRKLTDSGLEDAIISEVRAGKPILGICLGMQMLFERSLEYGVHKGLGFLKGEVSPMLGRVPEELKIPQIGWNRLKIKAEHPIFKYTRDGDFVYFVHSYSVVGCEESLLATTDYGIDITAAVALDNVAGMQFHPEKSGEAGLRILKAFDEWRV